MHPKFCIQRVVTLFAYETVFFCLNDDLLGTGHCIVAVMEPKVLGDTPNILKGLDTVGFAKWFISWKGTETCGLK
jgi:hypothetical protein